MPYKQRFPYLYQAWILIKWKIEHLGENKMISKKKLENVVKWREKCPICDKPFTLDEDPASVEWLRQKNGNIIHFHTKCFNELLKK